MTDSPHTAPSSVPDELLPDQPRRGFLASVLAGVIGVFVILAPLVTGTLFFLDPLLRRNKAKGDPSDENDGFVKVDVTLDELQEADAPLQVSIISSKVDKWNRYPKQPIGSVYLQMAEAGEVRAFNVTCPHLGCAVEYRETPQNNQPEYYCPCHNSAFELNGTKKNMIPPRDLDSLEVKVVKNDQDIDEIWVKYQEFRATLEEKVPV